MFSRLRHETFKRVSYNFRIRGSDDWADWHQTLPGGIQLAPPFKCIRYTRMVLERIVVSLSRTTMKSQLFCMEASVM